MRNIFLMLAFLSLFGCAKTVYVPRETVKTEYADRNVYLRDSILITDSVVLMMNGDTVIKEKWRTVYKDRWHAVMDSVVLRDSVQIPVPVERKLSRWEQTKQTAVGICAGFVIAFIVIWLLRRNRS